MDKGTLVRLVGKNPLNDGAQLEGYRELLGLSGHKPFECVGEFSESRWAFCQLIGRTDWQNDVIVQALKKEVPTRAEDLIFTPSSTHLIPEDLKDVLDEFKR